MIPRVIHYCWFGGGRRNRSIQRCMATWPVVMPDYEIREWNETNLPPENAYLRAALSQRLWSKVSNYVRLHALLAEGGVYLDTDVEVVRRFDPLLFDAGFIGFQQEAEAVDWVNNAILGAIPGHPFLGACMDAIIDAFDKRGEIPRGPQIATAVLRQSGLAHYGLQSVADMMVYPAEYFSPYPWHGHFSPDCVTENTFTVHRWQGSWVKPSPGDRISAAFRSVVDRVPGSHFLRATMRDMFRALPVDRSGE